MNILLYRKKSIVIRLLFFALGLSKEEIVGKYFSLLSDQEILDLYEKYKQVRQAA